MGAISSRASIEGFHCYAGPANKNILFLFAFFNLLLKCLFQHVQAHFFVKSSWFNLPILIALQTSIYALPNASVITPAVPAEIAPPATLPTPGTSLSRFDATVFPNTVAPPTPRAAVASDFMSAPFQNVDFRRNEMSFFTGKHTGAIQSYIIPHHLPA